MQLHGFHHLTAVTANAPGNLAFYTKTLGLRLVKKTVNQDDVTAYHLFYADGLGSPGTDITFFDWPIGPERRGAHSVARTGFRVASEASLDWWADRLRTLSAQSSGIIQLDARPMIDFEDPEGQRLCLVVDTSQAPANPWSKSSVPAEHQLRGLGPITMSVPKLEATETTLTGLMGMRRLREYPHGEATVYVFEMGRGGPEAELHVAVEPQAGRARLGAGGVHHVAFRTTQDDYEKWVQKLNDAHVPSSGPVDRYYFRSLYFREPNGVLFEIATDGPGFASDEPMETLGEKLSLPPFLEPHRVEIEAGLKPLA